MTRRAVPLLAVLLAATLASASAAAVIRSGQRAYCAGGSFQYEYTAGWFRENSYADVHQRLCLPPRGADSQFVDLLVRVGVQWGLSRNQPIFEPDSTWAKVEITVDGLVTTHRCEFPELSRMTPYQLSTGRIGKDGILTKHCRYALPPGDRVTVQTRFYGVEVTRTHVPLSRPITVSRDGEGTRCQRTSHRQPCKRIDL
ncbi:MAG TPA: hypothetical protein VNQ77_01635 [Frankiaceae bacterium]|nr:hypothetical protein [Frankiaceae bacterium]